MLDYWMSIAAGLVALIASAEALVRGAVWIARGLGVSKLMVGLTLVAFGTSAPELVVSVVAAVEGDHGFATGAVLGSNIANLGLIVGCAALCAPITMSPRSIRFELGFTIAAGVLPLLPLLAGAATVSRAWGVVLLVYICAFTGLLVIRHQRAEPADEERPAMSFGGGVLHVGLIAIGLAGLYFGGEWLVAGAKGIATELGMSDTVIGMTVIAIGTSLPELATAVVAALRRHSEIALGNVLGSNVFNVGMVLGTTAVIEPLPISWADEGPPAVLGLGMTLVIAFVLRVTFGIGRATAAGLLAAYAAYLGVAILTG